MFLSKARAYLIEAPPECSTLEHSYPQTLDYAEKACQGQTLYLIVKIRMLGFFSSRPFQPSLMFVDKARAYPSEGPPECSTIG